MKFFSLIYLLLIGLIFSNYNYQSQKENDIIVLLDKMNFEEMSMQGMIDMAGMLKETMPKLSEKFWSDFIAEINTEDLMKLIVPIYDKYLTHNDIRELIRFYDSPSGKKYVNVLSEITTESMLAGEKWGEEIASKLLISLDYGNPSYSPSSSCNLNKMVDEYQILIDRLINVTGPDNYTNYMKVDEEFQAWLVRWENSFESNDYTDAEILNASNRMLSIANSLFE